MEAITAEIRTYLADDHPIIVKGLSRVFEDDPDLRLIGTARSGKEALREILSFEEEPDVAVLDIHMPECSGVDVIAALKQAGASTKVLLLTGSDDKQTVYSAVSAGASGYMLKTADWLDIASTIKKIHAGATVIASELMGSLAGEIRAEAEKTTETTLTPREVEVLRLLSSRGSIASVSETLKIEPSTVRTHLRRIYAKLDVSSQANAVAEAMRRGLFK